MILNAYEMGELSLYFSTPSLAPELEDPDSNSDSFTNQLYDLRDVIEPPSGSLCFICKMRITEVAISSMKKMSHAKLMFAVRSQNGDFLVRK